MSDTITTLPPRQTANPSPIRPPRSIRRTSSIDVTWPDGKVDGPRLLTGRARDVLTAERGSPPAVLAQAEIAAELATDRTITAISAHPAPANLQKLVGERGGGHLRMVLRELMPELIERADPLYLLLDDISGISLISGWGWSLWDPNWLERMNGGVSKEELDKMMQERANVCWGLAEGNSGLKPDRKNFHDNIADGGDLRHGDDPLGWHDLPVSEGVSMRRARRIDVTRDTVIRIDSAFQDSAPKPTGGRAALHEYRILATVDPVSLELLSLDPEPRVLPFPECPGAVRNAQGLVGSRLPEIRDNVLARLRGTQGCTHLNDALRALADVPALIERLPA